MTLEARIVELAQAVGADIKQLNEKLALINLEGASENDLLQFVQGQWTNIPQEDVTDGGNF